MKTRRPISALQRRSLSGRELSGCDEPLKSESGCDLRRATPTAPRYLGRITGFLASIPSLQPLCDKVMDRLTRRLTSDGKQSGRPGSPRDFRPSFGSATASQLTGNATGRNLPLIPSPCAGGQGRELRNVSYLIRVVAACG